MNKYKKGWKTRRRNDRAIRRKQLKRKALYALFYIGIVSAVVFGVIGGVTSQKPGISLVESAVIEMVMAETELHEKVVYLEEITPKPVRVQVLELTREADIPDWKIETLLECENRGWDPSAYYVNKGGSYEHTVDRGLFMINDHFHPKLSNEQAFDAIENTKYAIELYQKTNDFRLWSCGKKYNI